MAKYARYTNFDTAPYTFTRKSENLEQHRRDVGLGEIVRSGSYDVASTRDRTGRAGQAGVNP